MYRDLWLIFSFSRFLVVSLSPLLPSESRLQKVGKNLCV